MDNINNELLEILNKLTEKNLGLKVTKETELFNEGIIDSFTLIELVGEIEKNYAISLSNDQLTIENFETVPRIANLITKWKN